MTNESWKAYLAREYRRACNLPDLISDDQIFAAWLACPASWDENRIIDVVVRRFS